MEDEMNRVPSNEEYNLMLSEAFQAAVEERLTEAEREIGPDAHQFFAKNLEQPENGRLYVTQGEDRYAVFQTWLGFVGNDYPGVAIHVSDLKIHEGTFGDGGEEVEL